jgi:hypothetical protein
MTAEDPDLGGGWVRPWLLWTVLSPSSSIVRFSSSSSSSEEEEEESEAESEEEEELEVELTDGGGEGDL